jgi:hypothetical protein
MPIQAVFPSLKRKKLFRAMSIQEAFLVLEKENTFLRAMYCCRSFPCP